MSECEKTASAGAVVCPDCGQTERIIALWMQKTDVPLLVYIMPAVPLFVLIVADLMGLFLGRGPFEWFVLARLAVMIYLFFKLPRVIAASFRRGVNQTRLCQHCGGAFVPLATTEEVERPGVWISGLQKFPKWVKLLELVEEFNGSRRAPGRAPTLRTRVEKGTS